jgi:hypothetical protein
MIFFQICGLAIIHKRNEPNFGYRSDMESIFFQDSCLVLATNRNSLSKYGACDPFFSLFPKKKGPGFTFALVYGFLVPRPPKKTLGDYFKCHQLS